MPPTVKNSVARLASSATSQLVAFFKTVSSDGGGGGAGGGGGGIWANADPALVRTSTAALAAMTRLEAARRSRSASVMTRLLGGRWCGRRGLMRPTGRVGAACAAGWGGRPSARASASPPPANWPQRNQWLPMPAALPWVAGTPNVHEDPDFQHQRQEFVPADACAQPARGGNCAGRSGRSGWRVRPGWSWRCRPGGEARRPARRAGVPLDRRASGMTELVVRGAGGWRGGLVQPDRQGPPRPSCGWQAAAQQPADQAGFGPPAAKVQRAGLVAVGGGDRGDADVLQAGHADQLGLVWGDDPVGDRAQQPGGQPRAGRVEAADGVQQAGQDLRVDVGGVAGVVLGEPGGDPRSPGTSTPARPTVQASWPPRARRSSSATARSRAANGVERRSSSARSSSRGI